MTIVMKRCLEGQVEYYFLESSDRGHSSLNDEYADNSMVKKSLYPKHIWVWCSYFWCWIEWVSSYCWIGPNSHESFHFSKAFRVSNQMKAFSAPISHGTTFRLIPLIIWPSPINTLYAKTKCTQIGQTISLFKIWIKEILIIISLLTLRFLNPFRSPSLRGLNPYNQYRIPSE